LYLLLNTQEEMTMAELLTPEVTIRELFAATDAKDVAANAAYLTEDIELRFGNNEPVIGKVDYEAMSTQFYASLKSLRHEIHSLWTVDDDVVITEMTVHYERLDGQRLSLPCANIFRLRDGLVADYRIFMDVNPVFA
jgi:ketosteroid isomerase-like protein